MYRCVNTQNHCPPYVSLLNRMGTLYSSRCINRKPQYDLSYIQFGVRPSESNSLVTNVSCVHLTFFGYLSNASWQI